MKRSLMLSISAFTVFVCLMFVFYNPTIAGDFSNQTFSDGEVFTPTEGVFDFKVCTVRSPNAKNYTAQVASSGHTVLVDETGECCINVIQWDRMLNSQKDRKESFIKGELEKPSWSVDGVCIHQIDFIFSDSMYAAYVRNPSTNTGVYIATPDEQTTADIANSLVFQ